jgi:hypothetical protein
MNIIELLNDIKSKIKETGNDACNRRSVAFIEDAIHWQEEKAKRTGIPLEANNDNSNI